MAGVKSVLLDQSFTVVFTSSFKSHRDITDRQSDSKEQETDDRVWVQWVGESHAGERRTVPKESTNVIILSSPLQQHKPY